MMLLKHLSMHKALQAPFRAYMVCLCDRSLLSHVCKHSCNGICESLVSQAANMSKHTTKHAPKQLLFVHAADPLIIASSAPSSARHQ